ncbi:MAG: hypothetical protein ACREFC_13300 [Stellaceae bacterium]
MNRHRLAGLGLVAALHVAVIGALLTLSHETTVVPRAAPSEELVWILPLLPKRAPPHKPQADRQQGTQPLSPAPALPDDRGITLPTPSPATSSLGGSLFGCADLDKLSPEDRTRCGSALAVPDNSVDFRDGTGRARLAARWERDRERKNAPLLLPCMSPVGLSPLATLACAAKGVVDGGIDPETQQSYIDKAETFHLPNNGDPPDSPPSGR